MEPIRVVLADDHTLFREGTRELLERTGDIEVVGEGADGREAVALVEQACPDVAIIDLEMPGIGGIDVIREIKTRCPATGVLALTVHDEKPLVLAAIEAGAAGYLLKDVRSDELVSAVRAVRGGDAVLHPAIAREVLRHMRDPQPDGAGDRGGRPLTDAEAEVLLLAAHGLTNADIAERLDVSARTVQLRLTRIFEKWEVGSRTEAVVRGLREKVFDLEDLA